jgi:hypothetical protein
VQKIFIKMNIGFGGLGLVVSQTMLFNYFFTFKRVRGFGGLPPMCNDSTKILKLANCENKKKIVVKYIDLV